MEDLESIVARIEQALAPAGAAPLGTDSGAGLISGDLRQRVQRVLFATELTEQIAHEAAAVRADLLVSLCRPPHALVGDPGRALRHLIKEEIALYSAEESAQGLIAEAISGILDLHDVVPLQPRDAAQYAMLVVYAPEESAEELRQSLAEAGAGAMGDYTGCAWSVTGTGEFTPQVGADPTIGRVGVHEQVSERRLEMVVPVEKIGPVTQALRDAHPYEEPAFSFLATHAAPGRGGRGRVGTLPEAQTARELSAILTRELPDARARFLAQDGEMERIAICSRVEESTITAAADLGAEALISADITSEYQQQAQGCGLGLIDLPRGALTWAALPLLARKLDHATEGEIETVVSTVRRPSWMNA